ncbi:MAG: alpha/beta hydrolase [Clostridiales bacterium]|jgi:acetyl esterase/lipase|nr:alpha/beta hydrolase [Clostridiales bacterium]
MEKDKISLYHVRTREKTVSLLLRPVLAALMSKGVTVNKVFYGEPKSKLSAAELYAGKNAKKPVLIYVHGGGWVKGSHAMRNPYCSRIAEIGFYVLNINYELAPEAKHPVQIRNIFRALSYAFQKKDEYNLDTENVFLAGDSSGAHLAALAAAVTVNPRLYDEFGIDFDGKEELKIKGLVLISGIFEFLSCIGTSFPYADFYLRSYTGHDTRNIESEKIAEFWERPGIRETVPAPLVNPEYPPCIVFTGEGDPLHPSSEVFYRKLRENGVEARYFSAEGKYAVHGFPLYDKNKNGQKAMSMVKEFLTERLNAE